MNRMVLVYHDLEEMTRERPAHRKKIGNIIGIRQKVVALGKKVPVSRKSVADSMDNSHDWV